MEMLVLCAVWMMMLLVLVDGHVDEWVTGKPACVGKDLASGMRTFSSVDGDIVRNRGAE